jgi:hypothetical protein
MLKQTSEWLTPENLSLTTKVLQNLDMHIEDYFNSLPAFAHPDHISAAESDVAEMVQSFAQSFSSQLLLMNGHGYRMLLTILVNALKSIDRRDLAEHVYRAKEREEYGA